MLDILGEANTAALIGLAGGILLGIAARVGHFCTLGAIEDALYSSDDRRIRMWGLAIGVAIIGTHIAIANDLLDGAEATYVDRVWNPWGSIIGGLMFGYGMALAGNCGYGALARLGGGDLRSFVIVIIIGLSAYFVMSGPLAEFRIWLFPVKTGANSPQSFSQLIEKTGLMDPNLFGVLVGAIIVVISLMKVEMRRSAKHIFWGAVVGLVIVSGWIGSYWISQVGFEVEPIETHSFAAPIGDTIFYSMTASGTALSFSVGSIVGVVLGACLGSYSKGRFRWEACEDPRELRRQIFGATLMGPGAILAVGCSVGQGISAFSLLAFSAPVVLFSIYIGAWVGLKQLITGFVDPV